MFQHIPEQPMRRRQSFPFAVALIACTALGACSDDATTVPADNADTGVTADVGSSDTAGSDATIGADAALDAPADTAVEAPTPDLQAYSGGECENVMGGMNTILSSDIERQFEVFLPQTVRGAPVMFFWYGAGGSSQTYQWLQPFATAYDIMIVVPRAGANMAFEWPIISTNNPANELVFFDDIVACLTETLPVDSGRIYTSGFSAGGLWSSYLVVERSHMLAAALIFSGGTGSLVREYETPEVAIPILGFYGGSTDTYGGIVNFEEQMTEYLDALLADGHLTIGCNHNGGHTVPAGGLDWGIQFLMAHSYGDTSSPFATQLPDYLPAYCDFWPL